MVGEVGLEPTRIATLDPKSSAFMPLRSIEPYHALRVPPNLVLSQDEAFSKLNLAKLFTMLRNITKIAPSPPPLIS